MTPKIFEEELKAENGDVVVWINSLGGDCFAAHQIHNMLKEYKGKVTVKVDGIAASAASVIAMAGDDVFVSPVSMMMIHNPLTSAFGNAKDMQKVIEMLDSVKDSIVNAYELKTGMSRSKISHLMDNETWMDAYKAVDLGFADKVLYADGEEKDEDEEKALKASAMLFSRREISNNFINKVSEHFKNQVPLPRATAEPVPDNPSPTPKEEPEPKQEPEQTPTQEPTANGRSVDMLLERLELIKKHI